MIVQIVWPDCDFLGGDWARDQTIDSFWVEASPEEGQRIIECFLQASRHRIYPPRKSLHRRDGQRWQYFLISRNREYVWSSPRVYPFSSQWNAYCPFRQLPEPIIINHLEELQEIHIPNVYRESGLTVAAPDRVDG